MPFPSITIIIPVKPGTEPGALDAIRRLDYPKDKLEVIVAEGRQPSVQRNRAARDAKGELLYFMDDDSMPPSSLMRAVAMRFEEQNVAVAGGPILTPKTDTYIQKGFGLALSSLFGGASIRARYRMLGVERSTTENELILANLCFRKEVFLESGGFNEELYPNEENELMNRLHDRGLLMRYVPEAFVFRSQRESFNAFARQVFTYGRGRMDQNFAHPEGFRPLHVAPSAFLAYLASLAVIHYPIYFLPLLLYLGMCAWFSVDAAVRAKAPAFVPVMPLLFLTLHLGYGAGFLWGLYKGLRKKYARPQDTGTPRAPVEVTLRKVTL